MSAARRSPDRVRAEIERDGGFLFARTCGPDMRSEAPEANGFAWPRKGCVRPTRWDPEPVCGNGLHGFLWGWGDPALASWHADCRWLIAHAFDHVDLDGKIKVPLAEVLHVGDAASASRYLWDAGVRGVIVPASRVLSQFAWSWWTALDGDARARLLLTLPQDVGRMSISAEVERVRVMLVVDWYVRTSTPTWLDLAGLGDEARSLREASPILTWPDIYRVQPLIFAARDRAAAAWAAAWAAAGAAARAAARDAAWAAARAAAGAAAWDAARDAAGAAAWAAAWAAARAAARDAAGAAARDALAPTVLTLQDSASALIVRMSEVSS